MNKKPIEMKREFKGIWIPAELWFDENLTKMELLFLVEIDSLDNDKGCFASNPYFANFFRISTIRCSQIISSLVKKGYIKQESFDGRRRVLKSCFKENFKAVLKETLCSHKENFKHIDIYNSKGDIVSKDTKRDSKESQNNNKKSFYLEEWNKNEKTATHSNNSKTYWKADKYCQYLLKGVFGKMCEVNKSFLKDNDIDIEWLRKKWSEAEIIESFLRFNRMHTEGYWPQDKKMLPRSLEDFIFNYRTGSSFFLLVMKKDPIPMNQNIKLIDNNPEITKIYFNILKGKIKNQKHKNDLVLSVQNLKARYDEIGNIISLLRKVESSSFNHKLGSFEKFAATHSQWLQTHFNSKMNIRSVYTTFGIFLDYVREYFKWDLQLTDNEIDKLKEKVREERKKMNRQKRMNQAIENQEALNHI